VNDILYDARERLGNEVARYYACMRPLYLETRMHARSH
jgi:hypothetical protein